MDSEFMFFADFQSWIPIGNQSVNELLIDQYPDSKFILNVRRMDHWIKSKYHHFSVHWHKITDSKRRVNGCYLVDCYKDSARGIISDIDVIEFWKKEWIQYLCGMITLFRERGLSDNLVVFDVERDPIDKLVTFFDGFGLSLNHWFWLHRGKSFDGEISQRQQQHIERWNDLMHRYPQLFQSEYDDYNEVDDGRTESSRILSHCNQKRSGTQH